VPFWIPSLQLGASQIIAVHTLLAQSVGAAHAPPAGQPAQSGPPQSWSDSPPFLTPSLQWAA
jgi:hypothetical protein